MTYVRSKIWPNLEERVKFREDISNDTYHDVYPKMLTQNRALFYEIGFWLPLKRNIVFSDVVFGPL